MPLSEDFVKFLASVMSPQAFVLLIGLLLGVVMVRYIGAERKAAQKDPEPGEDAKLFPRIVRLEGEVKYLRRDVDEMRKTHRE